MFHAKTIQLRSMLGIELSATLVFLACNTAVTLASGNAEFLDPTSRNSCISEILGFAMAIEYAPNRTTISDDYLQDVTDHLHSADL